MDAAHMKTPNWQIESLRKTFFFPSDQELSGIGIWREITGTDPADQTTKPLLRTSTEIGEWDGCTLTVSTQPGRVDLVLTPFAMDTALLYLDSYQERAKRFNALDLPAKLPRATRLAFGAVALESCSNQAECYIRLGEILKHVKISTTSRDFLYRINNLSTSNICNGVKLNCISTWGAIKAVLVRLADSKATEEIEYAIRVELDLNTDADVSLPNNFDINELFSELILIGQGVLDKGPAP